MMISTTRNNPNNSKAVNLVNFVNFNWLFLRFICFARRSGFTKQIHTPLFGVFWVHKVNKVHKTGFFITFLIKTLQKALTWLTLMNMRELACVLWRILPCV